MKYNNSMGVLLSGVISITPFKQTINKIASNGFVVKDDCYFLASLLPLAKNASKERFIDCVGYECFVNSIHIDANDEKYLLY